MSEQRDVVGGMLAHHLDHIAGAFKNPETMQMAIYVGRKDDPSNAYFVGNLEPDQIVAALQLLIMDSERLGTVNRDGRITEDGK